MPRQKSPFSAEHYIDPVDFRPAAALFHEGKQFAILVILKRQKAQIYFKDMPRLNVPLTQFVRFLEDTAWKARQQVRRPKPSARA